MEIELAVIGRARVSPDGERVAVSTPYGPISGVLASMGGRSVIFVSRHGERNLPPHRVNYRAILWMIKELGVRQVISLNTVGSMRHPVGSFFIPNDFVEFTTGRANTFYEDRAVHVEMREPYCPFLRSALDRAVREEGEIPFQGVYVCTQGPHLETPAQIRMLRTFGDVVGMTGYPEVVLARELCLCYGSLCLVTNPACGVEAGTLRAQDIIVILENRLEQISRILDRAVAQLPRARDCSCHTAMLNAEL